MARGRMAGVELIGLKTLPERYNCSAVKLARPGTAGHQPGNWPIASTRTQGVACV
jgi:hypothetical protein